MQSFFYECQKRNGRDDSKRNEKTRDQKSQRSVSIKEDGTSERDKIKGSKQSPNYRVTELKKRLVVGI